MNQIFLSLPDILSLQNYLSLGRSAFFRSVLTMLVLCVASLSWEAYANKDDTYQEIEWITIIPQDDLDALMDPPDYLSQIADGSAEDNMDTLKDLAKGNEQLQRFQEALSSTRIVEEYLNIKIRIPGFIVPLEGEDQTITEFFIVPFFGACLHMPPPPPNQIIHAEYKDGVELANLYDAFWFEGTLTSKMISNDLGASAYAMNIHSVFRHEE